MAIKRSDIKPPVLPKEAVRVEALGGEVVVRGMLLRERLAIMSEARKQPDGSVDFSNICQVLALCVLADDGKPVYASAQLWEEFGATHMEEAIELFTKCQALSGQDSKALKKS